MKRRVWVAVLLGALAALGQQRPAAFTAPEDIEFRTANVISEGTRLTAELFSLKANVGKKLPTIVMAHGWGGTAALLRPEALAFARTGYLAVAFDYRGWGASDSRVVLAGPAPAGRTGTYTAEVKEVREVVDPLDQTTDWLNVLHWVQGEAQCDTGRIGIWGSSYSGGHVVYVAARDPRVKALVSQVPALDSRRPLAGGEDPRKLAWTEGTQRARGEIGYPPPRAKVVGNLSGGPVREKLLLYAPVEDADKAPGCAMLFITAEKEELFDNNDHAVKAHARAKGPKKLVEIKGITHYGIYREARAEATKLAIEWYGEYLKK